MCRSLDTPALRAVRSLERLLYRRERRGLAVEAPTPRLETLDLLRDLLPRETPGPRGSRRTGARAAVIGE